MTLSAPDGHGFGGTALHRSVVPPPAVTPLGNAHGVSSAQGMDDRLISLHEIRQLFGLGRTAAYELTHRPGFPDPIVLSPRSYRWWASEVRAFATSLRCAAPKTKRPTRRAAGRQAPRPRTSSPRQITGVVRVAHKRKLS